MAQMCRHLIVAVLAGTTLITGSALGAAALPFQNAPPSPVTFTIAVRGQRVGQENVTVTRSADGWLISSTGSQAGPANLTIDKFEARYTGDWQPRSLVIEATSGQLMTLTSTFTTATSVTNDLMQGGQKSNSTHAVTPRTVVLPNNFFGAYEALAARLHTAQVGTTFPAYIAPMAEITGTVTSITPQRVQTPEKTVNLRHFSLAMKNPGGILAVDVTIDADGRLVRVSVPTASIVVLRDDLSSVMTRDATYQNDTDKQEFIQSLGFALAATTTAPPNVTPTTKMPAIVLIGGSGPTDRDENAFGIPIFGQLSGQLARAGFFVVRYDKRGVGQSGGRPESATLHDYAEDAISVVNWLRKRKDIDQKRIALVGHSEGGAVALLAGDIAGDKVAALALIAAPGMTGREIVLAQQKHTLDGASNSDDEKRAMVQLQTRILDAVSSGTGWENIPVAARRAADTLWFKSFIEFDPALAMKKADQPIMILQGALDTQVPTVNADRLEALATARKAKTAPLTKKVIFPGINHLLVPAKTGEVAEYASLPVKTISPDVAAALVEWLRSVMTKK